MWVYASRYRLELNFASSINALALSLFLYMPPPQADAPDPSRIPEEDIIGVTVILITCSYRDAEFVRVGYYVNNEYMEEYDPDNPPRPVDINKLQRNILADKPRVTRFPIEWSNASQSSPSGASADLMAAENGDALKGSDDDGMEMDMMTSPAKPVAMFSSPMGTN